MKKTLSIFLAILMMFSVCSIAFAEGGNADSADGNEAKTIVLTFYNHDFSVYETKVVSANGKFSAPAGPVRANETKEDGKEYSYTFRGWAKLENGVAGEEFFYSQTIPNLTEDTDFIAVYVEEEVEEIITFWNLIEMIFANINKIFEYFAKIFA